MKKTEKQKKKLKKLKNKRKLNITLRTSINLA